MKFKYLIIIFSILIVILVLITALLPALLEGHEFAVNFKFMLLPLILIITLLLTCIIVFFILNYRLFSLLEREDWPALSYYLENKIYTKNRYSARKVRLLAGSYLVILDYASVFNLENRAQSAKPSVIEKNALIFGTARILSGRQKEAVEFFKAPDHI